MLPTNTLRRAGLLAAATLLASSTVFAATYQWDANGASADLGGNGAWDTTSAFWDSTAAGANDGTDATTAYTFTNADTAKFGGTAGAVSLSTGVTVNRLWFTTAGYNLSGSTLTLAGTTPKITADTDATINSVIAGSGGFTKDGSGTLILGGLNSVTGAIKIMAGTLEISASGKLSSASAFDGGSVVTVGGGVSGSAKLKLNAWGYNTAGGFGQLDLGYPRLSLDNGVIEFTGATGGGQRAFTVSANGGTLISSGTGVWTIGNNSNNSSYDQIQISGALTLSGTTDANFKSYITGTGSIIKDGTNTWTFGDSAAANTYSGNTTINNGTLKLNTASALASGAGKGDVLVDTSGTLDLNAQSVSINGLANGANGGGQITSSAAGALTFTVGNNNATSAFSGVIQNGSGTVALTKTGTGTLTLSGGNTHSGGTTISGGTLIANNAGALGTGAVTVSGGTLSTSVSNVNTGALTLNNASSVLNLNGASVGTITLSANAALAMSAGTWNVALATGTDSIIGSGAGSTFNISGGTLDLGLGAIAYGSSYTLLSGFASGSVSGLTITGYDTTNYLASLSNAGALTFTAVPEPGTYGLVGAGALALVAAVRRRRRATLST